MKRSKFWSNALSFLMMVGLAMWQLPNFVLPAHAVGPDMLLFWDAATAPPAGWSYVTTYDGKFPRGETAANFGLTGGGDHTPTATIAVNAESNQSATTCTLCGSAHATHAHVHTATATISGAVADIASMTAAIEPVYRSLKLIQYSGIPSTIPAGAIAIFDNSPGMPGSGWTRYSSEDGDMIKVNNSSAAGAITTGGSDTHVHKITWSALGASTGTVNTNTGSANSTAANGHTHTAPAASGTVSITATPPHMLMVIAKCNADTSVPPGMIAMFDNNPGGGWNTLSNSGGTMYQRFVRGNATYNATVQGAATHTHAAVTSGVSGAASANANGAVSTGTGASGGSHTHTLTATFTSTDSNIPPYFNVVFGQKVAFTQSNYRWYNDSGVENVTVPWGTPGIAQNTAITPIPAPNNSPTLGTALRLRANLTVQTGPSLTITTTAFKLQYKQGTDATCTTGAWTDVGAGGGVAIWRYATSSITDGATLSASQLSPTSSVKETYVKTASSTVNPAAATAGQTIEYDFHIQHNGAVDASQYSFRIVQTDGELLNTYSVCPTLTSAPATGNLLHGGEFFTDQTRSKGYYWAN